MSQEPTPNFTALDARQRVIGAVIHASNGKFAALFRGGKIGVFDTPGYATDAIRGAARHKPWAPMLTRAPSAGSVMSRGPLQNEFAATGARTGGRGYLPGRGMDRARTYMRKESSNVHSKTRAHAKCDDSATWATRKGNGEDNGRSGKAFRAGAALKTAGASCAEIRAMLLEREDPDIRSKGHGWIRPLQILCPRENLPRSAAGRASGRREVDGIYLPADNRRHFVAWSDCKTGDFDKAYWNSFWSWYEREGFGHVAAYLAQLDLSGFDSEAPPPKTPAFWAIVDGNRAPEDAEPADVLDDLGRPDAVTISRIATAADAELSLWIKDRKNRRIIRHRLEQCGYVQVRYDYADDGLFKLNDRRQVIYAAESLPIGDRIEAANRLCGRWGHMTWFTAWAGPGWAGSRRSLSQ
jgi:hypothetical protein